MTRPLRLLTLAAGVLVMVGAGSASAQTVIVRNVGSASVELTLNGSPMSPGAAIAGSDATFNLDISGTLGKAQTDVHLFADSCGAVKRIYVEEAGRQPAAAPGPCVRKAIPDLFVIQAITSLVVDFAGDSATALIRQGPPPPEWLGLVVETTRTWTPAPAGLVLSGAVGLGSYTQMLSHFCGDAPACTDQGKKGLTAAGATFWFNRFFAADVGYLKPGHIKIGGTGGSANFTTDADTRILTLGARGGGQAGPVRISAVGGVSYTGATFTTVQTVDASTTTTAGTQTFAYRTRGWGWFGAGSVEHWVSRWVAIYGEGGLISMKGENVTKSGEGVLDDQATYVSIGVRVHLGR